LVEFRRPSDLLTLEFVDPAHLPETLGPGFALKEVFIETTTESVTTRLKTFLPWLPIESYLSGQRACFPDGDRFHCLQGGQFIRNFLCVTADFQQFVRHQHSKWSRCD
jgi:hypothetical protein